MKIISTVSELNEKLTEAHEALSISDAAMRSVLGSFKMDYPENIPSDPYSQEYRDYQFEIYESIAGKTYAAENEKTPFDVEAASSRPFPFYTGGCATVRDHLILVANMIGLIDLPVGSKILEFGPGWGNTTLFLAQMNYDVTAFDIEANFVDLIKRRAERNGVTINANVGAFLDVETLTEQYDAVIFFECFHHCDDHVRLVKALKDRVKPGGKIIFGAEPILADYPVPWGVRLDGESLWAAKAFGWLELGFNEDYFTRLLRANGWRVRKHVSKDVNWVSFFVATHDSDPIIEMTGNDPRIASTWGSRGPAGLTAVEGSGIFCFGPYIDVAAGSYCAEIVLEVEAVAGVVVEIAAGQGEALVRVPASEIDPAVSGRAVLRIPFEFEDDMTGVEVRISAEVGAGGSLTLVSYKLLEVFDRPGATLDEA